MHVLLLIKYISHKWLQELNCKINYMTCDVCIIPLKTYYELYIMLIDALYIRCQEIELPPKITPSNLSSNKLIEKIKWRIHQSYNTRFTWKTLNLEKNHGRCHKTTREKYSLCGKLLQPLLEIIFSHPSPKYMIPKIFFNIANP